MVSASLRGTQQLNDRQESEIPSELKPESNQLLRAVKCTRNSLSDGEHFPLSMLVWLSLKTEAGLRGFWDRSFLAPLRHS